MAWTYVQGKASIENSTAVTTRTVTFTSPVGSGNTVCGAVVSELTSATLTSVTDDKGNTYNLETAIDDAGNGGRSYAFSRSNVTGGPTVITATYSTAVGYIGIIADEFSGGSTASSDQRDVHGGRFQGSASAGTDTVSSGTFTTTVNGDLIYGVFADNSGHLATGVGTGFTLGVPISFSDYALSSEWRSQTTAAAGTAATFSPTVGSGSFTVYMIAMKPVASGGTAYTLTAATGAFALSGVAAKLAYGRVFPATLGTFALSGKAAGLAVGHKFAAVTGSFTLNGQAAGLQFGHRLVAAPGAFALAGQPAILRYSGSAAILTALPGAVALSGVAAKLAYARKFVTVTGSFVLSGQNATLAYARVLVAAKGAFALNGVVATLRAGRGYAAASGAFVLNGQLVNFRTTRVFPATVGVFNLASAPANLIYSGSGSKLLPAMRGQFVLNGQAAGSRLTRVMAALPGSFVLSGQAAGLRKDLNLSAAKGVFALLGNPANMIYVQAHDRVMPAQRGSFLLTGVNANLIANQLEKQPGPIEFGRPVWLRAW